MNEIPMKVAIRPRKILERIYADAYQNWPSRSIFTVSFEKAENVVNPPKTPVARNKRHSWVRFPLSLKPKTTPISKHPSMFTPSVPKGKVERNFV